MAHWFLGPAPRRFSFFLIYLRWDNEGAGGAFCPRSHLLADLTPPHLAYKDTTSLSTRERPSSRYFLTRFCSWAGLCSPIESQVGLLRSQGSFQGFTSMGFSKAGVGCDGGKVCFSLNICSCDICRSLILHLRLVKTAVCFLHDFNLGCGIRAALDTLGICWKDY